MIRSTTRAWLILPAWFAVVAAAAAAQAPATAYAGAEALGLALRRLGTTARVLMIGAHPDDENTAVLAALALGDGADVAYLSLTRGDGGQNGIGPELAEGLGLIRTDELLAARRIDGATQFFTRAIDYGFSKSADEAFRHWPRDSVLADVVAVIRRFRPDVVLSIWSGTPRDGHGQHQASGIVAREAFDAAADPARFPAQLAMGLRPHRAAYLYQSSWRGGEGVSQYVETGTYDPLFGRSHFQIAMASRSLHRSQDQGSAGTPGPQRTGLIPLAGAVPAGATSMFHGIDVTLEALARRVAPRASALHATLDTFTRQVQQATTQFNPLQANAIVPHLTAALDALRQALSLGGGIDGAHELLFRIRAEQSIAMDALSLAAGVTFDATVDDGRVVPGDSLTLTLRVWNGGRSPIAVHQLEPVLPAGWTASPRDDGTGTVDPGTLRTRRFRVHVPAGAEPTEPYYLREDRAGDMYAWPVDLAVRGLPFEPPPVRALAGLGIDGRAVRLEAEASYVDVDRALGEQRLPVLVVPAVSVLASPRVAVVPIGGAPVNDGDAEREITVTLTSEASSGIAGDVRLETPAGWRVEPARTAVSFAKPGERTTVRFRVLPPPQPAPGHHTVRAVFESAGARYDRGYAVIDYPHTPPRLLFRDAAVTFSAFPVAVAPGLRVGYIEGAGDDGPSALAQLGVQVELLDANAVTSGSLDRFDAIVAGIRAYEVRPDLIAANRRFLDWVAAGGTFIVQYNKQEFAQGGFAPGTVGMAGSADRVTDETAAVTLLEPAHPLLRSPNRIGPADFEGWVQERGLYFLSQWDDSYTPLLAMNDPGEPARRGSLLVARHGQGTYVYVALSFFRQWPEGVPGAYRLLANLVSGGR